MRVLLLLVALGFSSVWNQNGWAAEPNLETIPASYRTMADELELDGTVEAVDQATLAAKTAGTIVELNFDVNDFVKKGAVLLRFQGKRNQAGLSQAAARVKEAEARLKEAANQLRRLKTLFKKKMVTAAKMDEAQAARSAAQARLNAARAQRSSASESVSDTVVIAPFSGFVLKRFVQLGESAGVGTPLFSGFSMDQLRVKTAIPQWQVTAARKFDQVRVFYPGGLEQVETASRVFFPYAESGSHDFGVRVNLKKGVKKLFPGMLVKVAFKVGEQKRLLIPARAIAQRSEVTGVYVAKADGGMALRHVSVGQRFADGMVEVLAGLDAGERVALDPIRAGRIAMGRDGKAASQAAGGAS